jgi:histidinol-phosphate aminotransferase
MYRVAAATNDIDFIEVQLNEDFSLDPVRLLSAADRHTKLMFLCSPNNPTGNAFPAADIEKIVRGFGGMVVLDEAYIDFSQREGWLSRLPEFPNLIILQTLSKAWGMAGLRLGLAFAREDIIALFTRVKYPYNINVVTQKIVLEQLRGDVSAQIEELNRERETVERGLKNNRLVKHIFPSDANFVLAKFDDPRGIYDRLIGSGVIVRDRSRIKGCEGCLRITVGTPDENRRMLGILEDLAK